MIAGVSITTLLLVLAAGIGAGFVGYAVGASSLISYPALLAFGIPPVLSNTTNTVGVCGTGIGGLLSARRELRGQGVRVAVYDDGKLHDPWWLWLGVSFVGIYSGYFGAAAGTLALAILDLGKIGPFHQINALKTVVGFGANISAAIMFIIRGSVYWPFAIMMCIGCTIGSAIAPPVTRHIPENIMRAAAVLTGIILAVKLGWSTYF